MTAAIWFCSPATFFDVVHFLRECPLSTAAKPVAAKQIIRVGHSPDPDDAFMFHALANGKIDTGHYEFRHELVDIETLNRRAFSGELELTAVSIHAYAYLTDKYVLCPCGASMGDGYGPMVVAKRQYNIEDLKPLTIAVPGTLTTAYLALRLCLGREFKHVVVPFDRIIEAAVSGEYQGQAVDAGLIIHEGQLTYGQRDLKLAVDLGQWWLEQTGLPLPLGGNVIRRDLGPTAIREVNRLLKESIGYGLAHRGEALSHALQYGRDLDRSQADKFVGMYVNDWTLDFGPRGREAVRRLLADGHAARIIPNRVEPEFVEE
jgi:1,4-dihydroxy-6-naphthoate synthase